MVQFGSLLLAACCLCINWLLTTQSAGSATGDAAIVIAQRSAPECTSCSNSRSRQRSPEELQREKLRFEQNKILHKLRLPRPPNVHVTMSDLPSPLVRRLKADNEEFEKENTNLDSFYVRTHYSKGFEDHREDSRRRGEEDDGDDPLTARTKGLYIFSQSPRTGKVPSFGF